MKEKSARTFDAQERQIIAELIRNPRISDNQLGIRTNIPIKTVNRKRKLLEEEGILHYAAYVDHSGTGTAQMTARQIFIVEFREGITRKTLLDNMGRYMTKGVNRKHIRFNFIGEHDGRLSLVLFMESGRHTDLLEIFNAEIVPEFNQMFGERCIARTQVHTLTGIARLFNNYLPGVNMKNGMIRDDWSKDNVFVD